LSDRAFFDQGFDKVCDEDAKPALSQQSLNGSTLLEDRGCRDTSTPVK